ncbi:MAG: hypothetical protein K2X35_03550 [Bryobacteraceae bacterium]|nr:hypothetical protein [Bryobacteraceae bacterium]
MREESAVLIKERATGRLVEATLIDGITRVEVEEAEEQWRPVMAQRIEDLRARQAPRSKWPEHGHWDWRKKHAATQGLLAYRMLGLRSDGRMQGLMLVVTAGHACRIAEQKNKEMVYVDYVATAPWNSPSVVEEPQYGMVGRVLIAAAIQLSLDEGFKGRLGLHSLPQAEEFYRKQCAMTDLGADEKKQNLRYFEMTIAQAAEFLR